MKTIKMLSAACAVVFALVALTATAATAHEWRLKGAPLTKSLQFSQTATYTFKDLTIGAEFICEVEEKGTVGPGAAGQITSVKEVSCADKALCKTTPTIAAVRQATEVSPDCCSFSGMRDAAARASGAVVAQRTQHGPALPAQPHANTPPVWRAPRDRLHASVPLCNT